MNKQAILKRIDKLNQEQRAKNNMSYEAVIKALETDTETKQSNILDYLKPCFDTTEY